MHSDHKALLGLLKEDSAILHTVSARVQRWVLELSNYQYQLVYKFRFKDSQCRRTRSTTCRGLFYTIAISRTGTLYDSFRFNSCHGENCCFVYILNLECISGSWPWNESQDFRSDTHSKKELLVQLSCVL